MWGRLKGGSGTANEAGRADGELGLAGEAGRG